MIDLIALYNQGRLPPCWLLVGPSLITLPFAYKTAGHILSHPLEGPPLDPSHVSRHIQLGSHPDFFLLHSETEIGIESIRILEQRLLKRSPGWRVILIDTIDNLNRNSANALLKILEDPPEHTLFLGICHQLGTILPTLRSRFQKISFREKEKVPASFSSKWDVEVKTMRHYAYEGQIDPIKRWCRSVDSQYLEVIFNTLKEQVYQEVHASLSMTQGSLVKNKVEKRVERYEKLTEFLNRIKGAYLDKTQTLLTSLFISVS